MTILSIATSLVLAAAVSTGWAQPPAEPDPRDFIESDYSVGEGDLALPGTLTMPEGEGPFPAVVLVHGSGPNDRDETVGPNRPFLDIAHGLATQGVAVLRYDKRTLVHPLAVMANPGFGVDDEVTDDAVAAVRALRETPGIDPERVFVLGHSLGAAAAPRILERAEGAAGGVLFAAPARRLLDLLPEQVAGQGERGGVDPAAMSPILEKLDADIARLRAGEGASADQPLLGMPAAYWRSTDSLDPVAEADALSQPLLILHGGLDIQVTDADWQAWQAAFADEPRVTLKRYPELDHLGIVADADHPLANYTQPGHVDERLVDDVAAWIAAH